MTFAPGDIVADRIGKWRVEEVLPTPGTFMAEHLSSGHRTVLHANQCEPAAIDEPWRVLAERTERHDREQVAVEVAEREMLLTPETAGAQWASRFRASAAEREAVYYDDRGMG